MRPSPYTVPRRVAEAREARGRIVFTNGCFDLLHPGHVSYLRAARTLGDALVVGLNSDESVRRLKGPAHPIVPEEDRAAVLDALESVDAVVVFGEDTPVRLMRDVEPDVYVKGGDYRVEDLPEAAVAAEIGAEVRILPFEPGYSTTALVEKIGGISPVPGAPDRRRDTQRRGAAVEAMGPDLRGLLAGLYEWGRAHDDREQDRDKKMRNLEPETAALISVLVRYGRRTRLLEIGTSNGYSTIWLAWAASRIGGRVTSVELDPGRHKMADENLRRAGLRGLVDLELGDATGVVGDLPGPFDLVFFDADRVSAPAQLGLLLPKLAPDAMLLADNALSHPGEISEYLRELEGLSGFDRVVVPIGKGLSIAYRPGRDPTIGG